jgi:hypothetical protein
MAIKKRTRGFLTGDVFPNEENETYTGEVVLGNGKVFIGPCESDGMIGLSFVEVDEARPIGQTLEDPKSEEITFKTGSIVIWLGTLEAAEVLRERLDKTIGDLKEQNDND